MGKSYDQMPSLITPNALQRSGNRSSKVVTMHRIQYPAHVSSKLKTAQLTLSRRMRELRDPVERIVGIGDNERVVMVHDDTALCMVIRTLCQVMEQQRIVLRIPAPGRDGPLEERTLEMSAAEVVELASDAQSMQAQPTSAGDAGATASQPEPGAQAMPASPDASQAMPKGGWPDLMS